MSEIPILTLRSPISNNIWSMMSKHTKANLRRSRYFLCNPFVRLFFLKTASWNDHVGLCRHAMPCPHYLLFPSTDDDDDDSVAAVTADVWFVVDTVPDAIFKSQNEIKFNESGWINMNIRIRGFWSSVQIAFE